MANKDFGFVFLIGIHFLSFLSISTIAELYEILAEGSQLVVLHEKCDDRMSHLHIVLACGERSRHAKVQLMVRYLSSLIRDSIINRFQMTNHLKSCNIPSTEFDLEKLSCALFAQEGTKHNGRKLVDSPDKITHELCSRSLTDYLPLDLDCLDIGISEEKQKQMHLFTGNYDKKHYGDDTRVENNKELGLMEDNEGVR